jgi:hypothetical protein
MKYIRFEISHPFFCVLEDNVASQEVQKVQDITSFLLLSRDVTPSCLVRTQAFGQGCSPAFGRREAARDFCILSVSPETETYMFYYIPDAGEHPRPKAWVWTMQI